MGYVVCLSLALVGGQRDRCYAPAYNQCQNFCITYSDPCYQPALVCTPSDQGTPVASTEEKGDAVSDTEEDKAEAVMSPEMLEAVALAAADRPESLSPELPMDDSGFGISDEDPGLPISSGGTAASGFVPGFGSGGGSGGGFSLGNGQVRPGSGFLSGSLLGGGGNQQDQGGDPQNQDQNTGTDQDQNQNQNQPISVVVNAGNVLQTLALNNVNTNTNSNVNTNTQSQTQSQFQFQNQNQHQSQNNCCDDGGGKEVPLPATAWMGLMGLVSVVTARRRGWIG